jgi:plastocyanin
MRRDATERLTRRGFMRRAGAVAIAVPAVSMLLAACGGGGGGGGTSGGGGGKITIEMSEYKYNPSTITVSPGASVTVTLKNAGTLQHDFHCDQINPTEFFARRSRQVARLHLHGTEPGWHLRFLVHGSGAQGTRHGR